MASKKGMEYLVNLFKVITRATGKPSFDMNLKDCVKIVSGGNGSVSAVMTVLEEHTNQGGFLHGGMTALLVDDVSGLALMTYPNITTIGVSVNMNIDYLKACYTGQDILIKARTEKVGKRLAFLSVDIYNKGTGDLVAKGSHVKFIGQG